MKFIVRQLFTAALFGVGCFTPTFVRAAEGTIPPVPAPAVEAPPPPPPPATPAPPPAPVAPAEPELRRLDQETSQEKNPAVEKEKRTAPRPAARSNRSQVTRGRKNPDNRVIFFNDNSVRRDETVPGDVVTIFGDSRIDGEVRGDVVSVFGRVTINGAVNGRVGGVFGDITLTSQAKVGGDVIAYGPGEIYRHPDAVVGGRVEVRTADVDNPHLPAEAVAWWSKALRLGRPLAVGPHLAWLWITTVLAIGFYALLALVFPAAVRRCGDTLVQRPGLSMLSALLAIISIPVLVVLLIITLVGILLIPFLPVVVALLVLFGKAAICALIGRAISNDRLHPALATIVGGAVLVLFYLIPVAGFLISTLVGFLGFGCVICAMLTSPRVPANAIPPVSSKPVETFRAPVAPIPSAPLATAGMMHEPTTSAPAQSSGFGGGSPGAAIPLPGAVSSAEAPPVSPPIAPPVMPAGSMPVMPPTVGSPFVARPPEPAFSALNLPRVGFWLRLAALLIDLILVGAIFGPMGAEEFIPLLLAAYAAAMWKTKGTTIGGIICNLRVVRLDDRPLDWATAIVRALGCFLSIVIGGLGFLWVIFDDQKQSWHDKIAGTTVVRTPKTMSLV